ncbi:MAG: hypothetical protein ABR887_05080 [Methanoregulaceae archaeon]
MDEIETLDDLIKKKDKLITVIGVFGALAAFSIDLNFYPLTYSALAIFLLLSYELYQNIPRTDKPIDLNQRTIFSTLEIFQILFFAFVTIIYGYVGHYAFQVHPDLKISFILFFIAAPIANLLWIIITDWMKSPEIINLKQNILKFRIWIISMVILIPILWAEICYFIIKFFEYVK